MRQASPVPTQLPVPFLVLTSPPSSTSTVPLGSTLSYVTDVLSVSTFVQIPTSTVVSSKAATIFGIPVNGYNIVTRRQLDSTQSTGSATGSATATAPADGAAAESNDMPAGAIAGVAVSGAAGLVFLGLVFWFIRKRGIKRKAAVGLLPVVTELPAKDFQAHEMSDQNRRHEMPSHPNQVYEMQSQNSTRIYELPGHQDTPEDGAGDQPAGIR